MIRVVECELKALRVLPLYNGLCALISDQIDCDIMDLANFYLCVHGQYSLKDPCYKQKNMVIFELKWRSYLLA